jgi:pyruvate-ferredoxin/flavodoxin oxidoreductase
VAARSGSTPSRRAPASVPALVDAQPGLTGGVQNQPDFQAARPITAPISRRCRASPARSMAEYRADRPRLRPVKTFMVDDAETVMVGLGSVTDDAEAVATSAQQGKKVGVISIKLLAAVPGGGAGRGASKGKKAVTVLERCDVTALDRMVAGAVQAPRTRRRAPSGIPAIDRAAESDHAIFGLGAHDLQPRHLVAAFKNMRRGAPFVYLGSQFFAKTRRRAGRCRPS